MKKSLKVYAFIIWIIIDLYGFNYGLEWMGAANDILNIMAALMMPTIIISTICIYKLLFKPKTTKENEKTN